MRQAVAVAVRSPGIDEIPELSSIVLVEGFGVVDETVAERRLAPGPPWKFGALLVVLLAVVALVVSFVVGSDDEAAEPEPEPAPPTLPQVRETIPPRTTLPTVASETGITDLPGLRPAAAVTALLDGDLYRLDLESGESSTLETERPMEELFVLDGVLVARAGRDLVRVEPEDGSMRLLAEGVSTLLPGYAPASIVSVSRDSAGIVARVLGPDGVFRAGARLPGEALVHGSVEDRLVVSMAGSVVLTDGTGTEEGTIDLGPGRVLAIGPTRIARLVCDLSGCLIVSTDPAGEPLGEIPLGEVLGASAPERWSQLGWMSPSGTSMLLRLAHGNGALTGAVVVDLETGEERHSPEIGTDLGIPAWAPDSRYVIYPFHGDLMIWDTDSLSGQLRSSRASLRLDLSDINLQG